MRTVWCSLLFLLLCCAHYTYAVTGFSAGTCLEPITDERLEVINNPTITATGELFGSSIAARGRFLAIADPEQLEVANFLDVFRRDTILDTYGPTPYQTLTAPFLPSTAGNNDLALAVAMDDTWLVTCGTNGTHVFDYASGPQTWSHFQSIPYIGGATTLSCQVFVFCNRILVKITGTNAFEQYSYDATGTTTWIPFPGQPTLATVNPDTPEGIWNEPLREFIVTDTGGFSIYGMETCCSPLVLTQPFISTPSGTPFSIGLDIADRIGVGHALIDTVHIYDRTIGGTYPAITQTIIGPVGSAFGFALVFTEVDAALLVSAPLELISTGPVEIGAYYSHHETAGSYVLYGVYSQSTPVSSNGFALGSAESHIPVQPCGDYVFVGESRWRESPSGDAVGRVQTFCLSDEYCCGTCNNNCDLDNNICTVDICQEGVAINGTHTVGTCIDGPPIDVDDNNPCTVDSCDPVLGVQHVPLYSGECFFASDPCFLGVCDCGTCVNVTTPKCDDMDICTDDICLLDGTCINNLNMTICPTPTPTPSTTPSTTPSASVTPAVTPSPGASASNTPSASSSISTSPSATPSVSVSAGCQPQYCPQPSECVKPICDGGGCSTDLSAFDGYACGASLEDACLYNYVCDTGSCVPLTNVTDADCADSNPCTTDTCDTVTGCVHDPAPMEGLTCTPSGSTAQSVCFSDGVCASGVCVPDVGGTVVDCDDGVACTWDYCDSVLGCVNVANHTSCTEDSNECTYAQCHLTLDCIQVNRTAGYACSDDYSCTANDVCDGLAGCAGTEDSDLCPDTDACNLGVCSITAFGASSGSGCVDVDAPDTTPCGDLNECMLDGECVMGACTNYAVQDCNDQNSCTEDSCDTVQGCVHDGAPVEGDSCALFTGGACNLDGECRNSTCLVNPFGPHLDCDDLLTCTVERCDLDVGCFYESDEVTCEAMDTGDQCTEFFCDPTVVGPGSGCVERNVPDGTFCEETGVGCSLNGQCMSGLCIATPDDSLCTDLISQCEEVTCVAGVDGFGNTDTTCVVSDKVSGAVCFSEDENECVKRFRCDGLGICLPTVNLTVALACDDGLDCTADSCDTEIGCIHEPVTDGTACATVSGTSVCFTDSLCASGVCQANVNGTQIDCDDSVACTIDTCDSVNGCVNTPTDTECPALTSNQCSDWVCDAVSDCVIEFYPDGTGCYDGSTCTTDDHCESGFCMGTPQDNLCPSSECQIPICQVTLVMGANTTSATCAFLNATAGTSCGVEDECNKDYQCDGANNCVAQTIITADDCDEGNPCATYSCDVDKGCVQEYVTLDGEACGATFSNNGTCFLNSTCQLGNCLPDVGSSTLDCDDAVGCTVDICGGDGTCAHVPTREFCDPDPGPCSEYVCDLTGGCMLVNATDGSGCSDGYACTDGDTCQGGICIGTPDHGSCPDIDECNVGFCAPSHGAANARGCIPAFLFAPATYTGNPCDSPPNHCVSGRVCDGGGNCVNGTDISAALCEDFNSCTVDTCDTTFGCSHAAVTPGTACSTAILGLCYTEGVCTMNATCAPDFGGPTTVCDDTLTCTVDTCDSVNGCVFTEDHTSCESIPTGNPCTVFQCDASVTGPDSGCVEVDRVVGTSCNELGGDCSVNGECDGAGLCIAEGLDALCPSPAGFPCFFGICTTVLGVNGTESTCSTDIEPIGTACNNNTETECDRDFECGATGLCESQTTITNATCSAVNAFNPCVLSYCDPDLGCVDENLAPGTACGLINVTTSLCYLDSICNGLGQCISDFSGTVLNCTDLIECTVDGCDSVANCTHVPDDSFCTPPANQCEQSLCTGGSGTGCEITDKVDGTHCAPPGADECSASFTCQAGVCTGVQFDELCPDADLCNTGLCTTTSVGDDIYGLCSTQVAADGTFCGAGDLCNFDLQCVSGTCTAQTVITDQDCIDNASSLTAADCAMTECVPYYGCVTCPINNNVTCASTPFLDDLCFEETVCNDYAQCVWDIHAPSMDCLDAYSCTLDLCDSVQGCINEPDDTLCPQPQFGCYEAVCDPSAHLDDDDSTGCILQMLADNTPCDDKVDCTDNDICLAGVCIGVVQHEACPADLINECVVGFCEAPDRTANFDYYSANWDPEDPLAFDLNDVRTSGCDFRKAANGTICFGAIDECNKASFCQDGICEATVSLNGTDCTDYNDCTLDTCDPLLGCVHTPVAAGSACAVISAVDHQCFLEAECNDFGTCVPNIGGPTLDCTPTHTCATAVCDSVYQCVEKFNDNDRCPVSDNACEKWICDPSESIYANGCVLKKLPVGTFCDTGRPCLTNGRCVAEGLCEGVPLHAVCERDELQCSVDTCVADLADLDVDELGCRQSLLEGECRPEDPCITTGLDWPTFCDPETFACLGGESMDCSVGGSHVGLCVGGMCITESVDVADDDVDNYFHFDDWWFLFMIMLILMFIILVCVSYAWYNSRKYSEELFNQARQAAASSSSVGGARARDTKGHEMVVQELDDTSARRRTGGDKSKKRTKKATKAAVTKGQYSKSRSKQGDKHLF